MQKRIMYLIAFLSLAATALTAQKSPGVCNSERIICKDSLTGHELWQMTQGDSMSLMPYFECQAFTYDDKYAVFKSPREGSWKLFRTALADGKITKLSDRDASGSYSIFANGTEVIIMERGILYAINVESGKERILFDASAKIKADRFYYNSSFTNDGAYTVFTAYDGTGAHIYRVHLPSSTYKKVYSAKEGFSHPLINPVYPDYITFVPKPDKRIKWELSKEERARGMIVRVDKNEVRPFVMSEKYYRATHETWSKDGERFYYFDKLNKGHLVQPQKGWEISVASIDKEGEDRTTHYINNIFKLGHGIPTWNQEWFVADVERRKHNPLFLINLLTGEAKILCWANSSQQSDGNVQSEHIHPLFSKSGRYIAFSSDRNSPGTPQAFIVPIN